MAGDNTLTLVLEVNDKNFVVKMQNAGNIIRQFSRSVEPANRSIQRMERNLGGTLPKLRDLTVVLSQARHAIVNMRAVLFDWQIAIVNANAELERMSVLLRGMSRAMSEEGRMKDATRDLNFLIKTAQEAPFSVKEMTNTFVKMRSVGLDPLDGSFKSLLNSVAQFGGNDQILHRASVAIQQMAGKGIISMEELRQQLGEAVPTAMVLLARSMNMTVQDMVDAISKGQVLAKPALERLFSEFERTMAGASERLMATWGGLVNQLNTQWMLWMKAVGDTGFYEDAKSALRDLVNAFKEGQFEYYAIVLGNMLREGVRLLREFAGWVNQNREKIILLTKAFVGFFVVAKVISILAAIGAGLSAVGTAIIGYVASLRAMTQAQMAATASTAALNGAFDKSMLLLGRFAGPIGVALAALSVLTIGFQSRATEIQGAVDAINTSAKGHSEETIRLAREQMRINEGIIKQNREIAAQAEAEAAANARPTSRELRGGGFFQSLYHRSGARGRNEARALGEAEKAKAIIEQKEKEIADLRENIRLAVEQNIATEVKRIQREIEESIVQHTEAARSLYSVQQEHLAELHRKDFLTQEEYARASLNVKLNFYGEEARVIGEQIALQETLLEKAQGGARVGIQQTLTFLEGQLKHVQGRIAQAIRHEGPNELADSANKLAQGKLDAYLNGIAEKYEKAKAEAGGFNGEVAKFLHIINEGRFKGLKITDEQIKTAIHQLRETTRLVEKEKEMEKARNRIRDLTEKLTRITEKSTEKLIDLREEYQNGFDPRSSGMRNLEATRREFGRLSQTLGLSEEAVESWLQEWEIAHEALRRENAITMAIESKRATSDMIAEMYDERTRIIVEHTNAVNLLNAKLASLVGGDEETVIARRQLYAQLEVMQKRFLRNMETPMQKLNRDWQDMTKQLENAWTSWAQQATDAFVEFAKTGKLAFSDLVESILTDILRLQLQRNVIGPLFSGLEALFSPSGGSSAGLESLPYLPFAKGGVMSARGKIPLTSYASGGIARTPQLAMFGEGSRPEAFVPLPDGKRIPVDLEGQGGANVQVNVINQSGAPVNAEQRGQPRFDGKQMILDVVLTAMTRPGPFREGVRGAVR